MRRNVRLLRRCRWTLLAGALAIPTGAPAAQSSIPFAPGVVLTYVMHNLDQPWDREFNTVVLSVTPDETVFAEDMGYVGAEGKVVTHTYHRHQSRRELAGARTIDHGTTCNAADTVDTRYRGSTLRMASQRLMRQLKTNGEVEISSWYLIGCSRGFSISGTLRRVEPGLVPVSILLNGERLDLKTIHARGRMQTFDFTIDMDYWFLDDADRAWMIRSEGRQGEKTYLQQLGRVFQPDAEAGRLGQALGGKPPPGPPARGVVKLENPQSQPASPPQPAGLNESLDKMCRVSLYGIYFEFASAELKPASQPTLKLIADVMQQHPDWTLTIEGHTDSIGGAARNLELSNRRASAVRDALIRQYGVAAPRLAIKGYGLSRPVETNGTLEGRARNRRVELARACG